MAEENTPINFSKPTTSPLGMIAERNRAARTNQPFSTDRQSEFGDPALETFEFPKQETNTRVSSGDESQHANSPKTASRNRKTKAAPATSTTPTLTDLVVPAAVSLPAANVSRPASIQQTIDSPQQQNKIAAANEPDATSNIREKEDLTKSLEKLNLMLDLFSKNISKIVGDKLSEDLQALSVKLKDNASASQNLIKMMDGKLNKSLVSLDHRIGLLRNDTEGELSGQKDYVPLEQQKGFSAAIRRGIIDRHDDTANEKGVLHKIGRKFGNLMGYGQLTNKEREDYARATYQKDREFARASGDPAKRNDMLAHESRKIDTLRYQMAAGQVDTGGMSHDEYAKLASERMIKESNLYSLRERAPDLYPEYQRNLEKRLHEITSDSKKKQDYEYFNPELLDPKQQYRSGTDDHLISKEPVVLPADQATIPKIEPSQQEIAMTGTDGFIPPITTGRIETAPVQRVRHIDHNIAMAGAGTKETISADYIAADMLKVSSPIDLEVQASNDKDGGDVAMVKLPENIEIKDVKIEKLEIKELIVSALTVQSMNLPDEFYTGIGGGSKGPSDTGFPDIDFPDRDDKKKNNRGKKGKTGKMDKIAVVAEEGLAGASKLGKIAKLARFGGKLLGWPLMAATTAYDGFSGWGNAAENLGIEGREATTGEKLSSAAGGIVSGLSFGALDESTASKGIAKFFGAGPAVSPMPDVSPIPNQKQIGLQNAKAENDALKTTEKEKAQQSASATVIAPTTVNNVSGGGKPQMASFVRSTHNAYERFVDRTFTAV